MFCSMYKDNMLKRGLKELQSIRRWELLAEQRSRRIVLQDTNRSAAIAEAFKKPTFESVHGKYIKLQLSEWLREPPEDLSDWYLVPCPRGQRCLLVRFGEYCEMYSKAGRQVLRFRSALPRKHIILDAVYVRDMDAFYILDLINYGPQSFTDCDAQFRYFWLRSKFDEFEDIGTRSGRNHKTLHLAPWYDCDYAEQTATALQQYPLWPDNRPELDGFLFYHKEASYTHGTTPLVCWLFPFMVTEMLGLRVSEEYACPENYQNALQYMDEFDAKLLARKQQQRKWTRKNNGEHLMETEANADEEEEDSTLKNLIDAQRELEMEDTTAEEAPSTAPDML